MTDRPPVAALTDEQHAQLGEAIAEAMLSYAKASEGMPPHLTVSSAGIKFYLGDSAGDLVGHWAVTVERTSLA